MGRESFRVGSIGLSQNRLIAFIVAAVLIAAFFIAFKYSSWGIAMRASAEDGETAALMGIRQGRVSALAWVVAGVLAAVAALFLVGSPTPGVSPTAYAVALRAFPAAILGAWTPRAARSWVASSSASRRRWRPGTRTSCSSSVAASAPSCRSS
ncbi:ABC transporter permease subunit [Blastococcus brunescens]|uniref:Branched-chain amino acid transport system / permease component n=1 Tax=Blastococcus brunescens TaxID=1564165 RepID=A0ABZ1B6A6_9ACTN|nr:hypothetical protein [Blastococcus sp. BMG 8361]WRL65236.1 hypothetical protein U6N30_06110 [Blastococcus sp. BMG 8361]